KGVIDFPKLDPVVACADAWGVNVLFSVVAAPAWARPPDTDFSVAGPPADPADLARFVGQLAARYRGRVQAYEILNEQNLWYEWGGRGGRINAAEYVRMLAASFGAIKGADPTALVVSGAPTPTGFDDGDVAIDDVRYLGLMYQAGMQRYA